MVFIIAVARFGWYSIIGKRSAGSVTLDSTLLSPDGVAGFTVDGTTLLSVL